MRQVKGLKGRTATGGTCTLTNHGTDIGVGAKNLSQSEMDAYQLAKLQVNPANGGDWEKAKATLEAAGFEVFWQ